MSRRCTLGAGLLLVFALAAPRQAQGFTLVEVSPAQRPKEEPDKPDKPPATAPAPSATAPAADTPPRSDLSFDLLGTPASPQPAFVDPGALELLGARRAMLTMHQAVGYALVGAMAGSVITGQLNYSDRFGGPSTGRYKNAHTVFTGVTLGTFAGAGVLAALAPVPPGRERSGIDRIWVHEAGMIGATAGMVTEGALGILTASRAGASNQGSLAATHLAIGYLTLAFMSVAVGALVF